MKKRLLPITLLCLVGLIGAGCGGSKKKKDPTPTPTPTQHTETPTPTPTPTPTDVAVTGVELNKEQLELAVGGKEQLLATVLPENATNKAVTWKSSDPDVASVKDGLVTANEVGSANITVTTADGGFSKTCAVSVKILMESITITNKEEFAEFSVGQNRALVLESSPEVNFAELMSKGLIELTSSDPEIVNFSGLQVYALKKGQTTITVSVFGVSDTLELDVLGEKTAKELYGTVHEGTLEDPLDNADAVKIGKWAEEQGGSTSTPETFYIKGIVDSFYNAPGSRTDGMVAFYLKKGAEDTDRFEVYKTFFEDGTPLTDDDIWIGAEVLASGHITFYKSNGNVTYETTGAVFHGVTGGDPKPAPRETIQSTLAEVLSIGAQLDDGADSYDYYVFDAYVTVKSGDNYFLTAAKGEALDEQTSDAAHSSRKYYANAFEIYGAKAEGLAGKLMKNAKVTVKAILKNYHGQVENLIALTADDVTVLEEGELWVIPEHDVTVAQAIEETGKLGDGQTSVDFYNLKEVYVTEVTSAYSAQYGNMSFKVADAADAEQQLLVYRAKTDAETAAKVIVGAQVTIKGNLQKYVKGEEVTPELVNVGSITVKTGGEEPPVINYGTQENPLTVEEAKDVIDTVAAGSLTSEELWVEGVVSELLADSYGHKVFWMQSSDGQTARFFEGYQLAFAEGVDQTALAVGATVLLHGFAKNYKGTYEITSYKDASNNYVYPLIVAITPGEGGDPEKVPEPAVQEVTLKQFIDSEAADKTVKFHFSAEIKAFKSGSTKDKYGNMTLTDGENDLVVYGSTANAEKLVWNDKDAYAFTNPQDFMTNEKTKDLNVGDTVEVHFIRYVYNSVIQGQGIILSSTPGEGGQEPPVEEEGYKLDGSITGGSNGYAVASDITQEGINWSVTGNTTVSPWRVGGKNLDGVDRNIYSKTAIANNVNKIKISFGSSNITVNSINVGVYSTAEKAAAGGEGDVANFTPTFAASSIITVEKANETSWANCFYNIAINVTESSGSNKYVEFVSALFIYA